MATLSINGKTVTVNAEPDTPLLCVLRCPQQAVTFPQWWAPTNKARQQHAIRTPTYCLWISKQAR
jgi:hypothetical protein